MQISYTFHISSKQSAIAKKKQLVKASKHNLRKYASTENSNSHYDSEKIVQLAGTDNLYRDVEKVYHEQFDAVLAEYNKNQKRADRKILDYMQYVSENGKNDLAVEIIIQLGDKEFWVNIPEAQKYQMTYIFKDQLNALRQYIPEFVIANAIIHYDEASPHMQVIGVPVSSGYKRGLSKQCSKTRVFTKGSLEELQDLLRSRALNGMEKNPEIFSGCTLKPKETGRNLDYSKEYYIQQKKEKLKTVEEELSDKQHALSVIEEKTENAKELLGNTTAELSQLQNSFEEINLLRQEQETEIRALEEEKQKLHSQKEELESLKQEVEKLSDINCPFHEGDSFEVDGEMASVRQIIPSRRMVTFAASSGRVKELPYLDAVRAFNNYMKKEELTEERNALKQQIADLKEEYKNRSQVLSDMSTVWNVFRHFPVIKDFILEVGRMIRRSYNGVSMEDVKEIFSKTVLGVRKEEQYRTKGRSR